MATFTTGNQQGKKQDLSNIVKAVTPTDLQFLDMLGSESAMNSTFHWVDKLVPTGTKGVVAEGAKPTDTGANRGRVQRTNYTEIFADGVEVSTTAASTGQAGEKTYPERVKDSIQLIQRWKEQVFLNGQVGDADPTARKTASAQAQIDSSLVFNKASLNSPSVPTQLTKEMVDDALQAVYNKGSSSITDIFCTAAMKGRMNAVLQFAPVQRDIGSSTNVTGNIDYYHSDFGIHRIRMVREIRANDVLLCNSELWYEHVLVPMTNREYDDGSLAKKSTVFTEVGLRHANYNGGALITGVKATA